MGLDERLLVYAKGTVQGSLRLVLKESAARQLTSVDYPHPVNPEHLHMDDVTSETYEHAVVAASRELPVLVDVWGPRCGPCIKLMPTVERIAEEHARRVRFVKLDSSQNRRLCVNLGVMGLPTFLVYRDGQEVQRLTGDACTQSAIRDIVAKVTQGVAATGE
jgi:thioredoxin 1